MFRRRNFDLELDVALTNAVAEIVAYLETLGTAYVGNESREAITEKFQAGEMKAHILRPNELKESLIKRLALNSEVRS